MTWWPDLIILFHMRVKQNITRLGVCLHIPYVKQNQIAGSSRICEKVLETNLWLVPAVMMGSNCQSWPWNGDRTSHFNSFPPGQDGRHFADNIFRCIFLNKNCVCVCRISLKFFPKGPIDNNPALVQIMAWCHTGDKPLSETMLTRFTDPYMWH